MRKIYIYFCVLCILLFLLISLQSQLKVSLYPIWKYIEKQKILSKVKDFHITSSDHFLIYYEDEDKFVADISLNILEKYYDFICNKFDYFPKHKIPVIIYGSDKKLLDTIKLKSNKPPLGVYYSGVINVLSPRLWVENKENFDKIYEINGPLVHEFAHFMVDEKTRGNYPMWLTEGIALNIEEITTGFQWEVGKGGTKNICIEDLNDDFYSIDEDTAYRKSFESVKYIIDNYSFEDLNSILDNLGNGSSIYNSIKIALKIN